MDKTTITKDDIYNKLTGFSKQDLSAIASFVDFLRHRKKLEEGKVIKLKGILKGYDFDFSSLKDFKRQTWQHLEQKFTHE